MSSGGGKPDQLTIPDPSRNEVVHGWPTWLPGGTHVVFVITSSGTQVPELAVAALDTRTVTRLEIGGTAPRYVSTGHLVYVAAGSVLAAPFDLEQLAITGSPVPLVDDVMVKNSGAANFTLSNQGHAVYVRADLSVGIEVERSLVWVDQAGREEVTGAEPRAYNELNVSPDGSQVATTVGGAIEVHDLERGTFVRLTDDSSANRTPVWTPDGLRAAYASWGDQGGLFGHVPTARDRPSGSWSGCRRSNRKRRRSRRTGRRWSSRRTSERTPRRIAPWSRSRPAAARQHRCWTAHTASGTRRSRRQGNGLPTSPTKPVRGRSTCEHFQTSRASVPSCRVTAGGRPSGEETDVSCST